MGNDILYKIQSSFPRPRLNQVRKAKTEFWQIDK